MRQTIQELTAWEKKFKAKYQELEKIKQHISDINGTDLFNMTFEKYASKPLLQEYYENQRVKLDDLVFKIRNKTNQGTLVQQIPRYIRQQADNSDDVAQAFLAFESNPSSDELKEDYTELFNAKVDELHNEVLEWLAEYFEVLDGETERTMKMQLKQELPAPITVGNIETKKESEIKGIPYAYSRRQSRR